MRSLRVKSGLDGVLGVNRELSPVEEQHVRGMQANQRPPAMKTVPSLLLLVLLVAIGAWAQDPGCCSGVDHLETKTCADVCYEMVLTNSEIERRSFLKRLQYNCPYSLETFWNCINGSAPEIWKEDRTWFGRRCCEDARTSGCYSTCLQADSKNDLHGICSNSENTLFECINKLEEKERCCSLAPEESICWDLCENIFEYSTPTNDQQTEVEIYCIEHHLAVVSCVTNYTRTLPTHNPLKSMYCCDHAESASCRQSCFLAFENYNTDMEIMDAVMQGCGQPLPHLPIWQCFLQNSERVGGPGEETNNNIGPSGPTGLDGAHLQCCHKAKTVTCRDLCVQLYSSSWTATKETWSDFATRCQYKPTEGSLAKCLADVQEPCELGCSGLSYCTNFNNRPTELFRSCTEPADRAAAQDVELWRSGWIRMPLFDIPVLDSDQCQPDMWKAVACSLQVKPCHPQTHTNIICKADCVSILSKCIDYSRLAVMATPQQLCNMLSPAEEDTPCISLQAYMGPSYSVDRSHEVTQPCHPNPCSNHTDSALCSVQREKCTFQEACSLHHCNSGCRLGEGSSLLVHRGQWVQLPDQQRELGCHKACRCGATNQLEQCQLSQCLEQTTCQVGGQVKEHGSHFHLDCNQCACFSGEVVCTKKQCLSAESSVDERWQFTGLPCNCGEDFFPVCAQNGRTYPSACIARCIGMNDDQFEYGTCSSQDPCSPNPCGSGQKCVKHRRACLTSTSIECKQYNCISPTIDCSSKPAEPVCDTENNQHHNLCPMYLKGKQLAYKGKCQAMCEESVGLVCGQNGETYASLCAALSDRVTIDYQGACQEVGLLSELNSQPLCSTVSCPPLEIPDCVGITPPGACCPTCAGQLRVLFSSSLADLAATASNGEPVTLENVLNLLKEHVSVTECGVFGYLSIEGDIVILIKTILDSPTDLQIEACSREAEKLRELIVWRSPRLVSYLHLMPLLTATVQNSTAAAQTAEHASPLAYSLPLLLAMLGLSLTVQRGLR